MHKDIYEYITSQESNYMLPVEVIEGYWWSMKEHIRLTVLYKNSQFSTGKDDNKPFKNIIRPILNLQYRAEGFDVKDIVLYVNEVKNYYKSFFIRKYHNKWARENELDTFIDEMVECYIDFGGALIKNINSPKPEVVKLQSIAFCDQTDILSGPIGIKHQFSPDQLLEMAQYGWGSEANGATASLEDVIILADEQKSSTDKNGKKTNTPGKYIEVYEVHGTLPEIYLRDTDNTENEKYVSQMQIVCFYQKEGGEKQGITLFKGVEKKSPFKMILRDAIFGRALGLGGAEELFEPQVWTNYGEIRMKGLLDAAAKVIYQTADQSFASRNKTSDLENGEILIHDGTGISQVNTTPANITVFENKVREWEAHAQQMGSANDALMGESPTAGTPFKLQELVTNEGRSIHEYRKGKLATFLETIYRGWVIPSLSKEVANGDTFLAELELEEMQAIAESFSINQSNKAIVEKILNGELISKEQIEEMKAGIKQEFTKGGNKKFIEILKDDFKSAPIDVEVNIAGKQKDLAGRVEKLTNIFRTIISAPGILQQPGMGKLFNEILESSGLSPIDFSQITALPSQQNPMQLNNNQPMPAEQLAGQQL